MILAGRLLAERKIRQNEGTTFFVSLLHYLPTLVIQDSLLFSSYLKTGIVLFIHLIHNYKVSMLRIQQSKIPHLYSFCLAYGTQYFF